LAMCSSTLIHVDASHSSFCALHLCATIMYGCCSSQSLPDLVAGADIGLIVASAAAYPFQHNASGLSNNCIVREEVTGGPILSNAGKSDVALSSHQTTVVVVGPVYPLVAGLMLQCWGPPLIL
jgi:hypothetical protein